MSDSLPSPGWFSRLRVVLFAWANFAQALESQTRVKTHDEVERMVMLAALGVLHGVLLAPSALTLRLLPHFAPRIYQWRRLYEHPGDFSAEFEGGC
jgi:hypothetical protein